MKYFAGILIALAIIWPFTLKPRPEMQFVLLPFIAVLWLYNLALAKVFRLKSLPDIKDKKPACDILGFSVGIAGALFAGIPFAFYIFPWLEQCATKQQLISPIPAGPILVIFLAAPVGFYGVRFATLKIAEKNK